MTFCYLVLTSAVPRSTESSIFSTRRGEAEFTGSTTESLTTEAPLQMSKSSLYDSGGLCTSMVSQIANTEHQCALQCSMRSCNGWSFNQVDGCYTEAPDDLEAVVEERVCWKKLAGI